MLEQAVKVGPIEIVLSSDLSGMRASLRALEIEPGVYEVALDLDSPSPASPRNVRLSWHYPVIDCHNEWWPGSLFRHGLTVAWAKPHVSRSTSGAPVKCLHSASGENRLTFAASDALNPVGLHAGVHEETARFQCQATFFMEESAPVTAYGASLLIDLRPVRYQDALAYVHRWWASQPDKTPSPVPDVARLPMYSTWYSFHQVLEPAEVVRQCELARPLGCEAVIVDDGWQTTDSGRGYAYCGDWLPERIPDLKGLVKSVHDARMKFLLWYAVPLIGAKSGLFRRFGEKILSFDERNQCGVLDPRYPEIREYLIERYERAVVDWDLDGLKLDFVGSMVPSATTPAFRDGMDTPSVYAAADVLLSDLMTRLRAIRQDIMIEFRQSYIGPLMRKYGNIFRAADCPNDAISNRVRTLELRLLSGDTAVHADMLMWHPDEPVESAALQLLNVLFSVPQISVRLDRYPREHMEMLEFYLRFWREHRDVLLDGELAPLYPDANYPVVTASTPAKLAAVAYVDSPIPLNGALPELVLLVNATSKPRLALEVEVPSAFICEVLDCRGSPASSGRVEWRSGLNELRVPPSGVAICRSGTP